MRFPVRVQPVWLSAAGLRRDRVSAALIQKYSECFRCGSGLLQSLMDMVNLHIRTKTIERSKKWFARMEGF
jgi:hypothetical protein